MSNTIRSVLFSSPFNWNFKLNRMSFIGSLILLAIVASVSSLTLMFFIDELVWAAIPILVVVLGALIVQCKILCARMNEFVANRSISIALVIAIQTFAFFGGYMATNSGDTALQTIANVTYAMLVIVLLFTPATTLEQKQVQAF